MAGAADKTGAADESALAPDSWRRALELHRTDPRAAVALLKAMLGDQWEVPPPSWRIRRHSAAAAFVEAFGFRSGAGQAVETLAGQAAETLAGQAVEMLASLANDPATAEIHNFLNELASCLAHWAIHWCKVTAIMRNDLRCPAGTQPYECLRCIDSIDRYAFGSVEVRRIQGAMVVAPVCWACAAVRHEDGDPGLSCPAHAPDTHWAFAALLRLFRSRALGARHVPPMFGMSQFSHVSDFVHTDLAGRRHIFRCPLSSQLALSRAVALVRALAMVIGSAVPPDLAAASATPDLAAATISDASLAGYMAVAPELTACAELIPARRRLAEDAAQAGRALVAALRPHGTLLPFFVPGAAQSVTAREVSELVAEEARRICKIVQDRSLVARQNLSDCPDTTANRYKYTAQQLLFGRCRRAYKASLLAAARAGEHMCVEPPKRDTCFLDMGAYVSFIRSTTKRSMTLREADSEYHYWHAQCALSSEMWVRLHADCEELRPAYDRLTEAAVRNLGELVVYVWFGQHCSHIENYDFAKRCVPNALWHIKVNAQVYQRPCDLRAAARFGTATGMATGMAAAPLLLQSGELFAHVTDYVRQGFPYYLQHYAALRQRGAFDGHEAQALAFIQAIDRDYIEHG